MSWQDIVLSIGSWIFVIALIPAIRSREKPPLSTSLLTGTILAVFAVVYFTLELWSSVIAVSATSTAWFTLAVQKIWYNKEN